MSRRRRRKKSEAQVIEGEERFVPKPGPGSVFVEECLSPKTGGWRTRNINEHPLTLAHARGKISEDQFAAGEEVRRLWEMRGGISRDSTTMTTGGGSAPLVPYTQRQVDAIRKLDKIRVRLKTRDWIIVEKFCGEGWSMAEAVRAATMCHPSSVVMRVQEALEELASVRRGRKEHPFPKGSSRW